MRWFVALAVAAVLQISTNLFAAEQLRVGVFEVDASPAVGGKLAYTPVQEVQLPLSCRGIVILGAEQPLVLCAVDWLGIGGGTSRAFREQLARAVGTSADRVTVNTLHQHDAPWCDFDVEELLTKSGISQHPFESQFARQVFEKAAAAAARASREAQPFDQLGLSTATVVEVASNRRILGPDGRVQHVRWSASPDPAVRAFPEGLIDPQLRMISFWNGDKPVAALSYYATHPQSYYRTGKANPDFPGMARNAQQTKSGVPLVHFNGAAGNVTAGKYNDGGHDKRQILADRLADAMDRAWQATQKTPLTADMVHWKTVPVHLPPAPHLVESQLEKLIADETAPHMQRFVAANQLIWLRRCLADDAIDISCLTLGDARILHLPGELFVEYQLDAARLGGDKFIALAAYGDYSPGYIGTAISYSQGGYETQTSASFTSAAAEPILMKAIAELLEADPKQIRPLR